VSDSAEPAREAAETPEPIGEETATLLLALFQDFYRQEIAAEEDVHRTLPFFATTLGLTIAALSVVAGQVPTLGAAAIGCPIVSDFGRRISCSWPVILIGGCLAAASILAMGVLWLLARATARQGYRRIGPEAAHLQRAKDLFAYQRGLGLAEELADFAVVADLRQQLLEDLAEILPANRRLTERRYRHRARAVALLLWSLFCVLAATIIAVGSSKLGFLAKPPS
jgi:hypothetical protein